MKDLHASIAVDGFFGDSPFRFTTSMRLQQKREGPFEVGEGTRNITLTLDPRGWFVGNLGQVLDPRDPVNRGRIKANIRCSVRMSSEEPAPNDGGPSFRREFEDDDRDNRCQEDDDDEGENGGHEKHRRESEKGCGGDHSGDADDDHHGRHKTCGHAPVLVCGDGGSPPPDGGP